MYNYMKGNLLNSVRNHKKFFAQVICNKDPVRINAHCTNISWLWSGITCKRFYCQAAIQDVNILRNSNVNDENQQELDKFISNPDKKKFFQIIELEISVMRHNGEKVPNMVRPRDWLELLNMQSRSQRRKFLGYLFINEVISKKKKTMLEQEKLEQQAKLEEENETGDSSGMKYSLKDNTLFLRIFPKTIKRYYNLKVIWDMMFEPKIVFDCGYENYMTRRENHNCAKQLILSLGANRIHDKPMSLYFCNLKEEGILMKYIKRIMPNLMDYDFPGIVTSQSYLDIFPKDQLIYLTPHCRTTLDKYDPNMIYIIGAVVDKTDPKPLSFAKAKKEGIQMAKLPIDKYLDWGSGSGKNFTLNQMLSIMLDLKHTKSWKQALQHIPIRKLRPARENNLQRKLYKTSKYLEKLEEIKNNEKSDENQTSMKPFIAKDLTYASRNKR